MAKVYEFLADGFEDIEALAPLDILRRGGVEVVTVSIMGRRDVCSAHGVTMMADKLFDECAFDDADILFLPGGMPGASNLNEHEGLRQLLLDHNQKGKQIAAICAAPLVLGGLGLLKKRNATCYPGFEETLTGASYTAELVTVDGNITTGEGPAAALPFGYQLLRSLKGDTIAQEIAEGMRYLHLMSE